MTTRTRLARLEKARAEARRVRRCDESYTDAELETAIRDGVLQFCPEAALTDDLLQAIALLDFHHPVVDTALRRAAAELGLTPPSVMDDAFIARAAARAREVLGDNAR